MSAVARRGACPGLFDPMPTGDGLLARLPQAGPLAPEAFIAVCRAAARHGNGLLEATVRGSLQVRGLSAASAPAFAEACRAAGLSDPGGPAVIASPLGAGSPGALADLSALVGILRSAVAGFAGRLAPKVAIAVDDGGALHLDGLAADIRLRALPDGRFLLAVAGDGQGARRLGAVPAADAPGAVAALLEALAALGTDARARDLADPARIVARWIRAAGPAPRRPAAAFIGLHGCADGRVAAGLGLAFGQAEAGALAALAEAAMESGATGLAPAPERVLLALGLCAGRAAGFVAAAARLGFIARADDPRRNLVACAGAPACAAALMPARAIAAAVAAAARPLLAAGGRIHLSGCAKGCASRDAAALTVVGTPEGCAVIRDGRVGDAPSALVPPAGLVGHVGRLAVPEPA